MLNRYPLWKNLLILGIVVLGFLYSAANLYAPDPSVQVSGTSSSQVITQSDMDRATAALKANGIEYFGEVVTDKNLLIRLKERDLQLKAQEVIKSALNDDYVVALNLASTTPEWLRSIGVSPMKLGLDLSGGVHFLMEVDTESVVAARMESIEKQARSQLRQENIRYQALVLTKDKELLARFRDEEARSKASSFLRSEYPQFIFERADEADSFVLRGKMLEQAIQEIEDYAVNQNLSTLRNRVNELGVSEPIVQRQGRNRIVVELPGVQDTAQAKRTIGKTANLEFRLEAQQGGGSVSAGRERFEYRDENHPRAFAFLERKVVITGSDVTGATEGYSVEDGSPQVNIRLNSEGGQKMYHSTSKNVGRNLGVLFIEYKTVTRDANGDELEKPVQLIEKKIISLATIRSGLNADFVITGLENSTEAAELALLLRSGSLAAPMIFVQESTIGPSLGEENIKLGVLSVQLGLALVLIFMLVYYRVFGIAANIALAINLVLLVAVMSLFGATLTLPGIAGIVLTVGMAVDANVLIFSRIKEELKSGLSPQQAINAGFDRAFTTILDANVTTFIVAIILYGIGTGPIKGFAVTLAIGIVTSMFTAILGTRSIINLIYGGRTVKKLSI